MSMSAVAAMAMALTLAACGGEDRTQTTREIPTEPQDTEPNKGSPGADEPSLGKIDIAIGGRAFARPVMRLKVGQIVVWTNEDTVGHTVRAIGRSTPRSGLIPARGRFEFTPLRPGRIEYQCIVHPEMRGELVVAPR